MHFQTVVCRDGQRLQELRHPFAEGRAGAEPGRGLAEADAEAEVMMPGLVAGAQVDRDQQPSEGGAAVLDGVDPLPGVEGEGGRRQDREGAKAFEDAEPLGDPRFRIPVRIGDDDGTVVGNLLVPAVPVQVEDGVHREDLRGGSAGEAPTGAKDGAGDEQRARRRGGGGGGIVEDERLEVDGLAVEPDRGGGLGEMGAAGPRFLEIADGEGLVETGEGLLGALPGGREDIPGKPVGNGVRN